MMTLAMENNEEIAVLLNLPVDINNWNKDHVRQWLLQIKVDKEDADILYNQRINGAGLLLLEETDLSGIQGLSLNAKKLIIHNIGHLKQKILQEILQENNMVTKSCSLKPYPFNRFNAAHRYRENSILDVTESGLIDFIQPCHEFKDFTNTTEENKMKKFTYEVIRFAAACLNSRTNGTIHFGLADKPHGQILGVRVQNKDDFTVQLTHAIDKHFKLDNSVLTVKRCVKPPRFVEVLKADMMSAGKYVIEVDIEPSNIVCQDFYFNTYEVERNNKELKNKDKIPESKATGKKNDAKSFFIRDGSSTKNIITSDLREYEKYIANMPHLSQLRKEAEEKHLCVVKNSVQGSKLCEMITGGTQSMDKSHFEWYIVVANKSHPVQLKNLRFLLHMDLVALLDFDPESAKNGLIELCKEKKTNIHLPAQYKITGTGAVEDIANRLRLTKNTSWVFCNGGTNKESPSDAENWLIEKGSSVRDVVSFLCRNDVLPNKRFLVIFLLLSPVNDGKDPLLENFNMFLQELNGVNQILCISDNEASYTYWKDLIMGRYGVDISKRCICDLSFAEVNGTVLSLWSENRKSSRFLPCGGGSKVVLSKKMEESLETLSILCVNQCDGGNEDKQNHEEKFYKEGKVSWWNFYFSDQPGSMPFIKRDKFNYIINTIIPDICDRKRLCEFFSIYHLPGCGGTTLAMHVLWALRDRFRCAVLKDATEDHSIIAEHVVQLLTYETKEQPTRLPVLLLIDNYQDICDVKKLQFHIEEESLKQNIFSGTTQVIIVNCTRVEPCEQTDVVFIGNKLSEKELELFEEKLKEFKTTKTNTKTFYGFMILMTNFSSDYIRGIVKNTLKGFNFKDKHAQLFAVLVLLNVYCKNALLSVSTCEEFLDLQTRADSKSCKIEDGFDKFFTLLTRYTVVSKITFEGVRVIHSVIAEDCLQELSTSHEVTKEKIINLLLTANLFFEYTLGKQKCIRDVHGMLVRRQHNSVEVEDSLFSPLIQDIMKETPGLEETVLLNAAKCYKKDAIIFQLIARYYYIRKQDFTRAMGWAKKAKDLSRESSYICDTVSQILVRQLKYEVHKDKDDPIKPDSLDRFLTLAESAAEACKETQQTAKKEAEARSQRQRNYATYNTAGHLGELQIAETVIEIYKKITQSECNSVMEKHAKFTCQLRKTIKQNVLLLDSISVNFIPFFAGKEQPNKLRKNKIHAKYFQHYTLHYCKTNWNELHSSDTMIPQIKYLQTRDCLERNKGDSYTGLLEYLYEKDPALTLEEIIQQYNFLNPQKEFREVMDAINFIYANVILANIKPESRCIKSYQEVRQLLLKTLSNTQLSDILPLYYIMTVLLWQEAHHDLPTIVSQMKVLYLKELKLLSNGKRAAVHFYLGKDKGYGGLISHRDINSCLGSEQNISSQWDDEKLWKRVRDSKKLCRVSGEINNNSIWVADVKVHIEPMIRSQLRKQSGKGVTFFIGFSINGPVALDII